MAAVSNMSLHISRKDVRDDIPE